MQNYTGGMENTKNALAPRDEIRPQGLEGISDEQIRQHWKLYEGYVKNVNTLEQKINSFSEKGDYGVEFAELERRLGFEYNGMRLHEYYFEVLKNGQPPLKKTSDLSRQLQKTFGSFDAWKKQFVAMGNMRGTGWVILYSDPLRRTLVNVWVSSHEIGHPAGLHPILVLDVWEHAYMVDRGADGKPEYVEKFLQNIDWAHVESAFEASMHNILERK